MPDSFALLWRLDVESIAEAARKWRSLSQELGSAHTRHQLHVTAPLRRAGWSGEAATEAFGFLAGVEERLAIGRIEAETIGTVLTVVHQRMEQAQSSLRAVVREAEASGYAVDDAGTVTAPRSTNRYEAEEAGAELAGYRRRIDAALEAASQASEDGRNALAVLHGDVMGQYRQHAFNEAGVDAHTAMELLGVRPPRPPRDPKAAAKWWSGLSPDERREYVLLYPQLIGGLDGLPATVRDDANRLVLDGQLDSPDFATGHDYGVASDAVLDPRYRRLMKVKDTLDSYEGAPPGQELYLLGFNSAGDGQVIIAQGNPDTAAHTGVYVPGTGTTMDSTPGSVDRIDRLRQAAQAAHPDGAVSTVFWLGYDAPELNTSVVTLGRAEAGAPDLRHFVEGTRAAQGSGHHQITVIGHSYGSTLVGAAAKNGMLGADDIVAVGSPGMDVAYASSFGIPRDHVYAGASPNDPVAQDLAGWLGEKPTSDAFGGNEFTVAPGGHSSYFDQGSAGLENMGRIIAGRRPTLVHPAPPTDPALGLYPHSYPH
ncbi:alpha/beta hydrolase [Actinacidiphila acididurans]|uniref:DUF1023 domain-containing protein n=1 Tax=Actinacidiphila acididurans TaxID=2784346 RepID=A0ABS2TU06_9ACTN|nr:alpha/beta hydrolase [Actinacidiphila acididurans]MBM9506820.1 hypothetical protein [Actinacidiphila acididurans]